MRKRKDHINEKYGRLTVLEEAAPYIRNNGSKIRRLKCLCECSNIVIVRALDLNRKHTRSCGCLKLKPKSSTLRESKSSTLVEPRKKQGRTKPKAGTKYSKEYVAWLLMKQRCQYTQRSLYFNYDERIITVCDEWLDSFESFYSHLGPCPDPTYKLSLINIAGIYEPGNVIWSPPS